MDTHLPLSLLHGPSVLTQLTAQEALTICGGRQKYRSHTPEESLFLADEMNGQMPSVKWGLASPQRLGALARKDPPGDHGVLEAHGQDRVMEKRGR